MTSKGPKRAPLLPVASYAETREGACERGCVECCGCTCWVLLGLWVLYMVLHSIPASGVTDAPSWSRSLIWMSIAHHHEDVMAAITSPPPPPSF